MMKKRLIIVLVVCLLLSACTGNTGIAASTSPQSEAAPSQESSDPPASTSPQSEAAATQESSVSPASTFSPAISDENLNGYTEAGVATEVGDYLYFTDYKSVYCLNKNTGERTKIFSSEHVIYSVFQQAGYIFVGTDNSYIFRMDFDGKNVKKFLNMSILFANDGLLYCYDSISIACVDINGENKRFIVDWLREKDDIFFGGSYQIGYDNGKVYYQQAHKIYTMDNGGSREYVMDGDFVSLKDSVLIIQKNNAVFRKKLETGEENKIYSSQAAVYAQYMGSYQGKEYYQIDGYIISFSFQNNKAARYIFPYKDVEYATLTNTGWLYIHHMDAGIDFSRYRIDNKQKEDIAELSYRPEVFRSGSYLYYVDEKQNGIFQIDLNTNKSKKIYDGTIFVPVIFTPPHMP
jgi:hypothetical protein